MTPFCFGFREEEEEGGKKRLGLGEMGEEAGGLSRHQRGAGKKGERRLPILILVNSPRLEKGERRSGGEKRRVHKKKRRKEDGRDAKKAEKMF